MQDFNNLVSFLDFRPTFSISPPPLWREKNAFFVIYVKRGSQDISTPSPLQLWDLRKNVSRNQEDYGTRNLSDAC